jgi:hypothetical protein
LGLELLTEQNAPSLLASNAIPHRRRVGERNLTRDAVGLGPVSP